MVGQDGTLTGLVAALLVRGHVLLEGRARRREDPAGEGGRGRARRRLPARAVHPRPHAERRARADDLLAGRGHVPVPRGPALHEPAARRRDQPHAAEDPGGAARGDGGAPGVGRRHHARRFPIRSSSSPRRTRSSTRAPIPLPEAQLDRFLFKLVVGYPTAEQEQEVLARHDAGLDPHDVATPRECARSPARRPGRGPRRDRGSPRRSRRARVHRRPRPGDPRVAVDHARRVASRRGDGAARGEGVGVAVGPTVRDSRRGEGGCSAGDAPPHPAARRARARGSDGRRRARRRSSRRCPRLDDARDERARPHVATGRRGRGARAHPAGAARQRLDPARGGRRRPAVGSRSSMQRSLPRRRPSRSNGRCPACSHSVSKARCRGRSRTRSAARSECRSPTSSRRHCTPRFAAPGTHPVTRAGRPSAPRSAPRGEAGSRSATSRCAWKGRSGWPRGNGRAPSRRCCACCLPSRAATKPSFGSTAPASSRSDCDPHRAAARAPSSISCVSTRPTTSSGGSTGPRPRAPESSSSAPTAPSATRRCCSSSTAGE